MNYAIDQLMRAAEDAEHERESHAEELAEITAERDEARADLARLRAEHAAALDAARREGAEGMRAAALRCCSPDDDHFVGFHAPDVWEQIEREIRALPLDAPGGAS